MDGSRPFSASDLATRPPLQCGALRVFPATRQLIGPRGTATIPPRIMSMLLALIDSKGDVVTRDALVQRCWGDRFVAEDSLNGAVAQVRKALKKVGSDVGVETIPKTGYRLTGGAAVEPVDAAFAAPGPIPIGRRALVAGAGAAAIAAGAGAWWLSRSNSHPAAEAMTQGAQALRQGTPESNRQAVVHYREAVAAEPRNAAAWGMLALAYRFAADYSEPGPAAAARLQSERAARRALALDPRQSDALTALATLAPMFGDWVGAQRRIDRVLALDPGNAFALAALNTLLMSTGQVGASLAGLNRLAESDPLSPNISFRRVYTLWSAGKLAEMDRLADRTLQTWPTHSAAWFARFWTLAFTGRAAQARVLLADIEGRPDIPDPSLRVLDQSLAAIGSDSTAARAAAIRSNVAASVLGPSQATSAIMVISHLGDRESAMRVARGFLLRDGPVAVHQRHTPNQPSVTDQHHRMTMMLWVPASRSLRLHPGFRELCQRIGLVDYWRTTGTRPDSAEASLAGI